MSRKKHRYKIDGEWLTRAEMCRKLKVGATKVSGWMATNSYDYNMEKHFGFVPKYSKNPVDWIEEKGKRWFVVYEVNLDYEVGIDVGYGNTPKDAIDNFMESRKDSELEFTIKYVTKNDSKAQWLMGGLINERMILI